MYKLIAFDVDGTLVNNARVMTPGTINALRRLHDEGIHVVISSGRPVSGYQHLIQILGEDVVRYGSGFNGGYVRDLHENKVISEHALTYEDFKELYELGKELGVQMHSFDYDLLITPHKRVGEYVLLDTYLNKADMEFRMIEEVDPSFRPPKVMFSAEPSYLDKKIEEIPAWVREKYYTTKSLDYYFEIMPKGINKGVGLKDLAEKLGVKQEEIIAFGDGNNDISMVEYAGLGVAMDNATDELKAVSDYVTKSNEEEGILHALNHFIFSEDPLD